MAGLTAARELERAAVETVLVDKGRRPGGRMATRSIGEARFDHGAQHFGRGDTAFRQIVDEWVAAGIVREWFDASTPHADGTPNTRHGVVGGMRRLAEYLAEGLDVRTSARATGLEVTGASVRAWGDDGVLAEGSAVLVTAPVPQTCELLDAGALSPPHALRARLDAIQYHGCLAVMAGLDGPAGLPGGHIAPGTGPIAFIGDNADKGVSRVPAITIHSSSQFAAEHMDTAVDEWVAMLCEDAAPVLASPITKATGHRWRYAEPATTLDIGAASYQAGVPVALAGEVFAGARIEGAFLSGREAARQLLEMM
jgi:hypothetical protein